MTKLISVLILVLALLGGWALFKYYEKFSNQQEVSHKEAAARAVPPGQLPGLPYELQPSLDAAEQAGAKALGKWLKAYGRYVQDPRKAWIELDYCVMMARDDPHKAQRIFAEVKQRTPPTSPVWPRIQELEKSYE